jgi:hypothetical protein
VLAGLHHQRPVLGQQTFAALKRMFDQRRRRQIPENLGAGGDALCVKSAIRNAICHLLLPSNIKNGGGL